jgi:hypothetical protein
MTFMKHHKLPCHRDVNYQTFFDPAHYPGLCFMFNTKSYFDVGLENETFVTWGFEDHERFIRIEKLEKNTYYSPSCGYHLWHPRNSDFYDQVWFENDQIVSDFKKQDNLDELKRIFDLNKEELECEIPTWHWAK